MVLTSDVLHLLGGEEWQAWHCVTLSCTVPGYPLFYNSGVISFRAEDGVSVYSQLRKESLPAELQLTDLTKHRGEYVPLISY
jgi:hypothetical protein